MSNLKSIVNQIKHHLLRNPQDANELVHEVCKCIKPSNTPLVTPNPRMVHAGDTFLNDSAELAFNIRMYGLTESKPITYWVKDYANQDLLIAHAKNQLSITAAIYLAMERVKSSV